MKILLWVSILLGTMTIVAYQLGKEMERQRFKENAEALGKAQWWESA